VAHAVNCFELPFHIHSYMMLFCQTDIII